jgi:hyperosmotically inducible periplasmic protein
MRNMRNDMRITGLTLAGLALVLGLVAGCASTKGETTGQYVDDATITTAVKAKLAGDKASNLTRVSVQTVRGTVHLTGIVESQETKQRATQLSRQVEGVRGVRNDIQIQGASS